MSQQDLDLGMLDKMINYCLHKNKSKLDDELISKIHNQVYVQYNTLNIAVGRQRSGKTHTIIKEIIKISAVSKRTHLLIYINKNGAPSDPTFESLKGLITMPIEYVSEDNAEKFVQDILKWKMLYNYIKENHIEEQIQDKQMQTMFQKLHIDNLDFTTLHTLIFFEDAANCKLFNRSTNYFNQLFTRLAHVQCSVFIAVQFWKSLPTEIKSNAGTVFIFPNFSKEQLRYILRQVPLPEEFDRIYEKYQQLRDQQKLIVDINNQQLFIE